MAKSLFRAIAAMAIAALAPTAAHAVTLYSSYDFKFTATDLATRVATTAGDATGAGNSMTFRSLTDSNLKVTASAWSIDMGNLTRLPDGSYTNNSSNDIVTKATLSLYDHGFGVKNIYEDGSAPDHSIDNGGDYKNGSTHNMVDFVLLAFNWDVDVNKITTGWVGGESGVTPDSDATLFAGQSGLANPKTSTPLYDGQNVNGSGSTDLTDFLTTQLSAAGGSTAGTRDIAGNTHGMNWLIGALYGTNNNDYFKLSSLNVTVFPTVPEPSTWMTMILGFGFVGATMRRRKVSFGKAAPLA